MNNRIEAEKAILACLFIADRETCEDIFLTLLDSDFSTPLYKAVFVAAYRLWRANKPIDIVTVMEILEADKKNGLTVPVSEIVELATYLPNASAYETYANIILKHKTADKIKSIALQMQAGADEDPYTARDVALKKLADVGENKGITLDHYGAALEEAAEEFEAMAAGKEIGDEVKTPYPKLNYYSPLKAGELVIIAARPGVGKSAFVSELILHAGVREKKKVAFFNLEMSKKDLAKRMLSNWMRISYETVRSQGYDKAMLDQAKFELNQAEIYFDTDSYNIERIARACRVHKKRKGLDLVCIDYLQLVTSVEKFKDRRETVDYISRSLKLLALELNVPIVALSQFNRSVEKEVREPELSDLRESGAIEQDASIVILLHRMKTLPENYRENMDWFLKAKIAKNRNGATGVIFFKFESDRMRFISVDEKGVPLRIRDNTPIEIPANLGF